MRGAARAWEGGSGAPREDGAPPPQGPSARALPRGLGGRAGGTLRVTRGRGRDGEGDTWDEELFGWELVLSWCGGWGFPRDERRRLLRRKK